MIFACYIKLNKNLNFQFFFKNLNCNAQIYYSFIESNVCFIKFCFFQFFITFSFTSVFHLCCSKNSHGIYVTNTTKLQGEKKKKKKKS